MVARVIEFSKARNLEEFIRKLNGLGFHVESGPHVVLEDHSELAVYSVFKESRLVARIVAHYITQYYRAVLSNTSSDTEFLERLLEIKYSGERWSIPVNPLYLVLYSEELLGFLEGYEDEYPVQDGEQIVNTYRERSPNYKLIPRIVVARLAGEPLE